MMGESPTRPTCLLVSPPVEVAAARLPARSSATAPTVPLGSAFGGAGGALAGRALHLLQFVLTLRGAEVFRRHQHDALFQGELLGALADQQHVRALVHHQARQIDRVLDVAYGGHRPRTRPVAVHDGGIELRIPVRVEHRAAAGIELRVILHGAHRGRHGIQARAAALEDRVAGIERRRRVPRGRRLRVRGSFSRGP